MIAPVQQNCCSRRLGCASPPPSHTVRSQIRAQATPAAGRKSSGSARVTKHDTESAQRLSKTLAAAGVSSRRFAEEIISSGRVSVNGEAEFLPQRRVVLGKDKISIDGKQLAVQRPKRLYFALNKPKGYICSNSGCNSAQQTPRLAVDLLSSWVTRHQPKDSSKQGLPPRLFTVGRLDVQSTGLIFVTNDGSWANQVSHPSHGITKEYVVTTNEPANKRQLKDLATGCTFDGIEVRPVEVQQEMSDPAKRNKLRIVIAEGKNREIRQLVAHVGLDVTYLKRVRVGGYRLPKDLGIGQFAELKPHEIRRVTDKGAQSNPSL